ncbi:MAG TPA: hypothetical protein DGB85_12295 [Deltaproteobacteria bacterium]|nr:hypothetical protein [Deltaproteobacteria bacterium]
MFLIQFNLTPIVVHSIFKIWTQALHKGNGLNGLVGEKSVEKILSRLGIQMVGSQIETSADMAQLEPLWNI